MKKLLLSTILLSGLFLKLSGQCLTIACPTPITVNNDAGICGAAVTYTLPTMTSSCVGLLADTFNFTGAVQTYVVPAGVTLLTMETWGAQGGANWANNINFGGYTKADIAVTPGETLYIYVGGQSTSTAGGYNGGGAGDGVGKGGGGGSDVRQGGTALTNRIIVGGGGGGAGYWNALHVVGGVGGGLTGGDGYRAPSDPGGLGATQTAGGASGTCVSFNVTSLAGSFGQGGTPFSFNCGCEGYGGGGGWYGGAGSGNCRGGGGGSGYFIPAASNTTMTSGIRVGNGRVVIGMSGPSTPVLTQTAGLASGATFPVGTTTNTFIASDAFGNTATCSFQVIVSDNEGPVISGLSNTTVNNDAGQCGAIVNWSAPTITDNCSSVITSTSSHNSGDFFPVGATVVSYTAIEGSNSTTSSFTVTVVDNEAPSVVACPSTIVMCPGVCSFVAPTTTDNCSATISQTFGPLSGDTLTSSGAYPIAFLATDASGNITNCGFTIYVVPDPIVTLDLGSLSFACVNSASFTLTGESPAGGTWSGPAVTGSSFDPASAGAGTHTITYSFTDANGCSSFATDTIHVDVCTGIAANGIEVFRIYPNPANGFFWINTTETGTLEISDATGKLVKSEKINSNRQQISLNGVAAGTYLVRFNTVSGISSNGQLIIQK